MYREWRFLRMSESSEKFVDLDHCGGISEQELVHSVCRFLTEVRKLDGSDFPGKTLYDIVICIQFQLESEGFSWKLLMNECFRDIRYTLDNLMKERTAKGIGVVVKKAQVLNEFHEDLLWSLGLLGVHDPNTLLNTVVFLIGKGCALRAGKEHRDLRAPPFNCQLSFVHDFEGKVFLRYTEEAGFETNKGGLKHRKIEPKVVDVYPIQDQNRCPVRIFLLYLSKLPFDRNCDSLYLQPKKDYTPDVWYLDRPVGVNRLRNVVKDLCSKAGIPGFFSNHSLRSTCATNLYQCNIDEQLIQEITGHRSLAVRSYKRTCDSQRRKASNCIFDKNQK